MKFKKIFLLICLLICLFAMASVCASDANDTAIASEDTDFKLSADNEMEDNLQTNEENPALAVEDNDETVSAQTDSEILTDGQYTYSDLREQIGSGGNKNLTKGIYTYNQNDGDTIEITDSGVIDGKCAVIDMAGSSIRVFTVSVSGVTIKNLTIKNANFNGDGGAIYFSGSGTVEYCNFTNNRASGNIGVIGINVGNIQYCNFVNNSACNYGVIWIQGGSVEYCNFTNNSAASDGAVAMGNGNVTNCNFNDNQATNGDCGAVCFWDNGNVTNCNFTANSASGSGGAVFFQYFGNVANSNFVSNKVISGSGGAIKWTGYGNLFNCNFTNNTANSGGAIYIYSGNVTNCNFEDNNATTGSAIYFDDTSATNTVSNSIFLNNRANKEALEVTKNDNNITIIFTGNDNLLNAIYSNDDVTFTNVTYWGANGIVKTGSSAIKPSRSNNEAGQNITVGVVINGELVLDDVEVTDEKGMIVLDIIAGENYYINVRHETDSYYTEAEKTISTMKFSVNVTSQTTNNRTVNITAKSNVYSEVMQGKVIFIVPNSSPIAATYGGNGIWWALHTFDDYTVYEVNATYMGLDNVTINNATVTISRANSTLTVDNIVFDYNGVGSTTVSFTGATGVNASVVDQPNSKVNVAGNAIKVSGLNVGTYYLTVTTIADADHNSISKTVRITVNKLKTSVSGVKVTTVYGNTKNLVITLKDVKGNRLAGKYVTVILGKTTYKNKITNSKGQITIVVPKNLVPKTYTASITFDGDKNYAKSTGSVKVEVKKATPKITAKTKKFKKSVKIKKYTVTLKTNKNKVMKNTWVTLKVNKKIYKAKTSKYGKATFKIKNLTKKGKYTAKITYKGNYLYKKATKKVKIVIK